MDWIDRYSPQIRGLHGIRKLAGLLRLRDVAPATDAAWIKDIIACVLPEEFPRGSLSTEDGGPVDEPFPKTYFEELFVSMFPLPPTQFSEDISGNFRQLKTTEAHRLQCM